jgi:hypothetical protein
MDTTSLEDRATIVKLTGPENYGVWSAQMKAQLVLKDCDEAIRPADTNAAAGLNADGVPIDKATAAAAEAAAEAARRSRAAFKAKDYKAMALLTLAVADHLVESVDASPSARAA